MTDTIYALATAAARAAIAVVRISGPEADAVLGRLTSRSLPEGRRAAVRKLIDSQGAVLDEAMVLRFPGPASFTGEDVVELHLHGGRAVVSAVLAQLRVLGLREAMPGEFTRRAFEHGRLDLSQAEAIADLVDAETEGQRSQALGKLSGALARQYGGWREALIGILALLEAAIDFPDEDLPDEVQAGALAVLHGLRRALAAAVSDMRGETIRDGYRIALIGAPNAGKSSLFNALVGRDAAIVTSTAGTTRDIIEAQLVLAGFPVLLADTAGLRDADDVIEAEGVRRARRWAEDASLRLWVLDLTADPKSGEDAVDGLWRQGDWLVGSKVDLAKDPLFHVKHSADRMFAINTANAADVNGLRQALTDHISEQLGGSAFPSATRARHREILRDGLAALDRAIAGFGQSPELVGEDVRLAARALERLSGRIDADAVLDRVFATFCIGK